MPKKFSEYKELNLKKIFIEIIKYWKENKVFQKTQENFKKNFYSNKNIYVLYEGPPSLNGPPGIHHILSRTIKDIFCRYNYMKGKIVFRKAGWDTHGLPVEINVEKKIGINKNDIGKKISVENYNKICEKFVNDSLKEWELFTEKMGFWIDLKNNFKTCNSKYIESVWWILKKFYKKNLLYKDYIIQPYSPAAGTGLSYHELNMPGAYKKIEQISPIVKFKLIKNTLSKDNQFKNISGNIYLLSWTTTPWTLPSNTALSVGINIDYVLIKIYNHFINIKENIIISEKSISNVLPQNEYFPVNNENKIKLSGKKIPYLIINKFKGKKIINVRYEQLLPWFSPYKNMHKAFRVVISDSINVEEGTGIVHISPTFGLEDFLIAKKYDIPSMLIKKNNLLVPLVDFQGKFLDDFPYGFDNKYINNAFNPKKNNFFSVDEEIVSFLKKENKIFKSEKYKHFYPHCWRTGKPIIYYPLHSWFINNEKFKNKMIILNDKINWYSNNIDKNNNRFDSWLKNVKNWNISRTRFWGTPLPIWTTKNGKEKLIIGSIKELIFEINKSIKHGIMSHNIFNEFIINDMSDENYKKIDLHKHILDKLILVSPKGNPMKRDPDLLDVWFDSGSMPYAQFHYPFENKGFIDNKILFPSDFISEGSDQTRGWFFTLHIISSAIFKSYAYKNVVYTGLILDKNGYKMSKSKGNTIDPIDLINNYGPDSIRWYIIFNSNPWDNIKFDMDNINIVIKKFFSTLYNIYSFFALYANIDGFIYKEKDNYKYYTQLDLWILSELNTVIKKSNEYYKKYNPTKVVRLVDDFVLNQLSNWYIRLNRRRFWKNKYTKNKISAYQVVYNCLLNISKIISPIVPFLSEKIYIDLNLTTKKEKCLSIHLSKFPDHNNNFINKNLEKKIRLAQKIVNIIFSLRKKHMIKIRQPLKRVLIIDYQKKQDKLKDILDIILKEANVKEVKFTDSYKNLKLIKYVKPNYKLLGPKFGNNTKQICKLIKKLNQKEIKKIEDNKEINLFFDKKNFIISLEDVKIITEYIDNWAVSSIDNLTIALDLNITKSLKNEGIIREIIRYTQYLRKKLCYVVTEKILIYINNNCNYNVKEILIEYKNIICKETLSMNILFCDKLDKKNGIEININNNKIFLQIKKFEK
ncbi:isoleucine--tRNA ligase [Blattabacterium cuenoti]|uniref:isoleucine--tRNA ligase n=1 Tax=Blattabacterium cuenoti TaxID=1653831 RepID=UPI00163C8463|nr:isoleucine--tRNA ligase [Blattabacterium cuenoti]